MPFNSLFFTGTTWFVRDGDIYVSSIGSDVSGNGQPLKPYRTIQKAVDMASPANKIVVGNGNYDEKVNGLSKNLKIVADGQAIMKLDDSGAVAFTNLGSNSLIDGFFIHHYGKAVEGESVLENCLFEDTSIIDFEGILKKCIVKDCVLEAVNNTQLINCTFVNVQSGTDAAGKNKFTEVYDSHFDSSSIFEFNTSITTAFDYCNQQSGSQIKINGVTYATAATVHAAHSQYQEHGISAAPQFNDTLHLDYSLKSSSPLLKTGRFFRFIGARGEGDAKRSTNLVRPSLVNVLREAGRYKLVEDYTEGTLTTRIIDLGKVRLLGKIRLFAEQLFEEPPFNGVVDFNLSNRPPNLISFQMRYSVRQNKINREEYREFAWDKIPTIDNRKRGNAHPLFNFSNQRFINARYIQLIITLRSAEDTFFLVQENDDCLLQENNRNIIWKY